MSMIALIYRAAKNFNNFSDNNCDLPTQAMRFQPRKFREFHSWDSVASLTNLRLTVRINFSFISKFNLVPGLITRYQDSGDNRHVACREIEIYRKDSNVSFPELFVSCPFAEETEIEGITYRLEYLVVGSSYEYSKKLVFIVPRHTFIGKFPRQVLE